VVVLSDDEDMICDIVYDIHSIYSAVDQLGQLDHLSQVSKVSKSASQHNCGETILPSSLLSLNWQCPPSWGI